MSELAKSLLSDGFPPVREACDVEISIPEMDAESTAAISGLLAMLRDSVREMYLYGIEIPAILEEVEMHMMDGWSAQLHGVSIGDTCSLQLLITQDELIVA